MQLFELQRRLCVPRWLSASVGAAPGVSNHNLLLRLVHQQVQDGPSSSSPAVPAELCCGEGPAPRQGPESLARVGLGMISETEAVPFDREQRCN